MFRARWRVPPPHAAVQLPHGSHVPTVQSTGQGNTLHAAISLNVGHGAPPPDASVTTVRVCVMLPPPHVAEHEPNADHCETTHGTGHACGLHGSCSRRPGHGVPSICAVTTERVRCLKPPLHSAVHPDHEVHSDTTQSTGHNPLLHSFPPESTGQASPLPDCCTVIVRERDLVPTPHVTEHVSHSVHELTSQLTPHGCVLQMVVSESSGHSVPPLCGV
jgi:hypothetical protein